MRERVIARLFLLDALPRCMSHETVAIHSSGPLQEERIVAVAGAAGVELAVAPPCSVTVPGAGSAPPPGAKVTRSPNGGGAAVSVARVRLFTLFVQLAVRVNVVAGAGSGTTLTLILAASAEPPESTAASVKAVPIAGGASGTA